jgi:hypothetical protein
LKSSMQSYSVATTKKGNQVAADFSQSDAYIHTQYGRFYVARPKFDIRAVAWSLGQQVRYTGHGNFPYHTADHCVLVSRIVGEVLGLPHLEFEAHLHDAAESGVADVASPFKRLLPDYRGLEDYLMSSLRAQYGMPAEEHPSVKFADHVARFIEAPQLVPEGGEDFSDPLNARPLGQQLRLEGWSIHERDWRESRHLFLQRYYYLKDRDGRQIDDTYQGSEAAKGA